MFNKLICNSKGHDFTNSKYLYKPLTEHDNNVKYMHEAFRVCNRCGFTKWESERQHNFGEEFYLNFKHIKICMDCGFRSEEKAHLFGENISSNPCVGVLVCKKCGFSEEFIRHKFEILESDKPNSCTGIQKCRNCGEVQKIVNHNFEFINRLTTYDSPTVEVWEDTFVCQNCGLKKIEKDIRYKD
jgi:hypothetical protein